MKKIAIITDTNSGITSDKAKELGIFLVPMPIIVDGIDYLENESLLYDDFLKMLSENKDISTSQPSPFTLTSLWDELLNDYDEIVYIPMSSSLSGACSTGKALALDYDDKVFVVDNRRISVTQYSSVLDALSLKESGYSASEICEKLEKASCENSIYLAVNTLELLKKSGRVTPAGATFATILGLKPVLQIQGGKLDAYAKARGMANAERIMQNAAKEDIEKRYNGKNIRLYLAYSGSSDPADAWLKSCREFFNDDSIEMYRLPISICCHVGADVKGIGVSQIIE